MSQRLGPWRDGCSRWILGVEFADERSRNVERVRGIHHWHLATVNNDVDASCLRKSLECFADVLLKWREDFLPPLRVSRLSVFTFALKFEVQLIQLLSLLAKAIWIRHSALGLDFFGQCADASLKTLQFGLSRLEFAIQGLE